MIGLTDSPVVKTNYGQVRGRTFHFGQHSASAYLGIPYAKAPVGTLRFKKPQPIDEWAQIQNCNNFGGCCPFIEHSGGEFLPRVVQSEDCLYLNVFAPVNKNNTVRSNLPVLFYIHGGGYVIGNSAQCGDLRICKYLCSKDLIVVTINYRLGLFGFFTTGDSNAAGNYGLWDQAAALQWVRDNISQFGGNPKQITVAGHSAGAASADLLAISPHTRDLFQNVILIGGASSNNWALTRARSTLRKALELAKKRGFQPKNASNLELLNFLRQLPADDLKVAAHGIPTLGNRNAIPMHVAPVIDGDFFPKPLDELRKEAPKKNVLAGVAEHEGLMFAINGMRGSLEESAKVFIRTYVKDRNDVNRIQQIFAKMVPSKSSDYDRLCVQVMSDLFINFGLYESAENYLRTGGNVFLYTFEHIRLGISGLMEDFLPFLAASHGTEIAYLFGSLTHSDFQPTKEDERIIDKFTTYFANFARSGDPSTHSKQWLPITSNSPFQHMIIKSETDEQKDDFCGKRPLLWHKLLENNRPKL